MGLLKRAIIETHSETANTALTLHLDSEKGSESGSILSRKRYLCREACSKARQTILDEYNTIRWCVAKHCKSNLINQSVTTQLFYHNRARAKPIQSQRKHACLTKGG